MLLPSTFAIARTMRFRSVSAPPRYGEKYSDAIAATGYDCGTIADAKWLADRIEFSDRSEISDLAT